MLTIALALALLLGSGGTAHAAFLVPIVAAALSVSPLVAGVIVAVGATVLSVGVSYVANKLLAPKAQKPPGTVASEPIGGVQLDIRIDADVPQSLIVGRAVTAGSLAYAETFGQRGEVDNSDLIEIIALADHPCHQLVEVYVEGQKINPGPEDGDHGFPVGGYDEKLWYKFFNGSQTSHDNFTENRLHDHSERPWSDDAKGRGVTYLRAHYVYDPELVPGRLRWRAVLDGIRLYDPRKDSTVGGSGSHRWATLSTHEFTRNLAVIAYNILRGIRVADSGGTPRHFFGIENTPAASLPLDVWFAAMNECDVDVDGKSQYHGGAEIPVSAEPLEVIKEILKACDGRLVEIGGVYKLYVGPPGLPVLSITDESLRANEGDEFRPILPLEQRINYVTGTYTRPEDGWLPRVAPPRADALAEARDGRRVPGDLNAPWVQSGEHLQRLQKQMLARAQRERRHKIPLGPEAWGIEPGDVIEWTSDRNGYIDKLFEVDAVEDDHALNMIVSMTEIDPSDYDWNAGTDLIAEPDGSLVVERPAPKIIEGFDVDGVIHLGTNGTVRPGIRVIWIAPTDGDLVGVEAQYRLTAQPSDVAAAHSEEPDAESLIILAGIQSLTEYEVRARFTSFNGYGTEWSLWLPVLTPDARMSLSDVDALFGARIHRLDAAAQASYDAAIRNLSSDMERLSRLVDGVASQGDAQSNAGIVAAGVRITQAFFEIETEGEIRSTAITAINARLDDPATGLNASATAIDAVEASITSINGTLTAQGLSITSLDTRLDNAELDITANSNAVSSLTSTVTSQGNTISAQGTSITSLDSRLDTAEADIAALDPAQVDALATAVDGLTTDVTALDGEVTALSTAFSNVFASNAEGEASAMFRLVAHAEPTGVAARVALEAKTEAGTYGASSAAMYLDVVAGLGSCITFVGDRFRVQHATGVTPVIDVTGSVVSLNNNVKIDGDVLIDGTLTVDKIVTNVLTQTKSAKHDGGTQGGSGMTSWSTICSISGVVVDDDVSGMVVTATVPGSMSIPNNNLGSAAIRVKWGSTVLQQQAYRMPTANVSGSNATAYAPLSIAAIVGKSELSNGNNTVELEVASTHSYSWGSSMALQNYGPARLGIQTPRR